MKFYCQRSRIQSQTKNAAIKLSTTGTYEYKEKVIWHKYLLDLAAQLTIRCFVYTFCVGK